MNPSDGPRGRQPPGFEGLFFLAMIGAVGASLAGGLFAAGFALLPQTKPGLRGSAESLPPARPGAAPRNAVMPPSERTLPIAARLALAQGDAILAAGNAPAARFFYERAIDAGDALGALRMGETFDPAFLADGRRHRRPGDPTAARFWYRRALGLGVAEARARLDHLAAAEPAAQFTPSESLHRRAVRRHERSRQPQEVTLLDETPAAARHPKTDGP